MTVKLPQAWFPLRPHKVQSDLVACADRFMAVAAGRGSGKTELAKRKLIKSLGIVKPWPDPRYFYGAPTEQQAKHIAWDDLRALLPKQWAPNDSYIDKSSLTIRTIFGSTLRVFGLDKPQRIEGKQYDGGVIDESCDIKPGVVNLNIMPTLVHRDGWLLRIGVPKRNGCGAAEFHEICTDSAKGYTAFEWESATVLTPEQLRHFQEHMDVDDYDEQFRARWVKTRGGIFHAFDKRVNVRPCQHHDGMPLIVGSDFNVDPMCWVLGHAWPDRIEWFDELNVHNTNTPAILKKLYQRYSHHLGGFEFYGDSTARSRHTSAVESDYNLIEGHEGFKELGRSINYPSGSPEVEDRFSACNAMFHNAAGQRRMFIDDRCVNLIKSLESYSYVSGTRIPAKSGFEHIADAMGYAVHWLFPIDIEFDYGTPLVMVSATQTKRAIDG